MQPLHISESTLVTDKGRDGSTNKRGNRSIVATTIGLIAMARGVSYFCPTVAPWSHRRSRPIMRRLHKLAMQNIYWRQPILWRWIYKAVFTAIWPLNALSNALYGASIHGKAVKAETSKGYFKQVIEQVTLAYREGIPSTDYYRYSLYEDANRAVASDYIGQHEVCGLLPYLNGFYRECDEIAVDNKREFARFCESNGFPTARLIAVIRKGTIVERTRGLDGLPQQDFIMKPVHGKRGNLFQRWCWVGDGHFRNQDGITLSTTALLDRLCADSKAKSLVLQERLHMHSDLSSLTNGALGTVRVVAGRAAGCRTEIIGAYLRLPFGSTAVDNIDKGGIGCPVDLKSGTLGAGITKNPVSKRQHFHPDTGAPIDGTKLPCWPEALDLVRCAHDAIRGFVFLGWDVAITKNGPLLIEANDCFGIDSLQRSYGRPVGAMRFVSVCQAHLSRLSKATGNA